MDSTKISKLLVFLRIRLSSLIFKKWSALFKEVSFPVLMRASVIHSCIHVKRGCDYRVLWSDLDNYKWLGFESDGKTLEQVIRSTCMLSAKRRLHNGPLSIQRCQNL